MEELNIKVTKMTADALRKVSEEAHLSIGEVVDRYALNVAPYDPKQAVLLIVEHYLICVSRLSQKGSDQVFGEICGVFLGTIPPEELDEVVSRIKSTRNWEHPAVEPPTEEERMAFRKTIDSMTQSDKAEYMREVLYSLLHG